MRKPLILSAALILLAVLQTLAGDFPYGERSAPDLLMKKYDKDTSAHAVVLNEFGKAYITDQVQHMVLFYEYHVKIKIFDSKGFDKGNVEIELPKQDNDRFAVARDIKGTTTYLDENNVPHTVELDDSKIFRTTLNKYYNATKFTMPSLKPGCVIEYKYTVELPFIFNFHPWEFQWDIPKVHSEFNALMPAIYNYNISLRGPLKLSTSKGDIQRQCLRVAGIECDCSDMTYGMDNIPAFKEEDYMTARKNFISAISFELSDYTSLQTGAKVKVTKEWKDIDYDLKKSEFFGSQIKRKGLMEDRIKDVIAGKTDPLARAKAVYAYIQHNIKWDGFYGYGSDDGIRQALDKHSGGVGDVNLALIAGLNAAGINTEAVLLSTRSHGVVNKLYPVETDFNYVIAKANIGDKSYYLDATDPMLGFGMLPLRCINDQGRVMSMDKPSYWIDMVEPQKKNRTITLDLTLQPDGKLKGTYICYSMGYEAYLKRNAIKKFNTIDEYIENLDEKSHRIKIHKATVNNVDSLDMPLAETYEMEIDARGGLSSDKFAFNPYVLGRMTVNPFKLEERSYPVDMGMPEDERFILSLHIPDNYTVESAPEAVGLALPNQGGSLITNFANDGSLCTYSQVLQFKKSVYAPEEYPYLKEMFNKIIHSQKTEIVLKKK